MLSFELSKKAGCVRGPNKTLQAFKQDVKSLARVDLACKIFSGSDIAQDREVEIITNGTRHLGAAVGDDFKIAPRELVYT